MRFTCAALLLALCTPAGAQYRCSQPGGGTSFQQTPCPAGAREQKLDIRAPAPDASRASVPRPESSDERLLRQMTSDRRIRETEQDIANIDNAIDRRDAQMAYEIEALRQKKSLARNNLAGATWEQSISTEMQAVSAKYRALNDSDRERQKLLRNQLAELRQAAPRTSPQ